MNVFSIFFNALVRLSYRQFLALGGLSIQSPLFFILAIFASVRAYKKAQTIYPKTASKNGKGNAFRHAYWNCLIMMYCCKISSPQKALDFTKKFTDLHERLFPNEPLEQLMDLHNNQVGRDYFMSLLPNIHRQFFETTFFIEELVKKTENAQKIQSINEKLSDNLVYIG